MDEPIGREALALANEVDKNQKTHDELCALRYTTIGENFVSLSSDIEVLFDRMWKMSKGIIILLVTLLLSMVGVLFTLLHGG